MGQDVLLGDKGFDRLNDSIGNDHLYGGYDADVLIGWEGNDHLEGGAGASRDWLIGDKWGN